MTANSASRTAISSISSQDQPSVRAAFCVDAAFRLGSGDDGDNASTLYAITDPATEHKGLLIDVFDEICYRDPVQESGPQCRRS